jgi:hypothetical protein
MEAVAKIESDFDPKQRMGSYIGLFQLSRSEFTKYGSGDITSPRDNAVAAAYKLVTEASASMFQGMNSDSTCLTSAQDWLGHRSIQHTVRYTELSPTRFKDFWRE